MTNQEVHAVMMSSVGVSYAHSFTLKLQVILNAASGVLAALSWRDQGAWSLNHVIDPSVFNPAPLSFRSVGEEERPEGLR